MIPLPAQLGGTDLLAWRLTPALYERVWDDGQGSFDAGGRWNGKGVRAVYCSLDPATAILEVAANTGFIALDTVPYTLTSALLLDPARIHIVQPEDIPDARWLHPGLPGKTQQDYGDGLLARQAFVLIPSAVSTNSWNIVFVASRAEGLYRLRTQERFVLDPRLHRPRRPRTP